MMYVSYRSMSIMEDAMNKLGKMSKYECIIKLLLHDLNVNVSICGYKK